MGSSVGELATPIDVSLGWFAGDTVAIDGYIVLYQFLTGIRNRRTGDYVRNDDGQPISHLIGLKNRMTTLLEYDIQPIFVLDGGAPDLKDDILEQRDRQKRNAQVKFEAARRRGDYDAMQKWARRKVRVTDEMLTSTIDLLDAMGIPVVISPTEGEPQATQLVLDGVADHVVTEDHDAILYQAPRMVKSFSGGGCQILTLAEIQSSTGYSFEEVLWYGILRGTDYNESPHGVGSVRGQNIIDAASSFDDVIDAALEWDDSIDPDRWREVKRWFENPDVDSDPDVTFEVPDYDAVAAVLVDEYGFTPSDVASSFADIDTR